jgi:hypothetical protein
MLPDARPAVLGTRTDARLRGLTGPLDREPAARARRRPAFLTSSSIRGSVCA